VGIFFNPQVTVRPGGKWDVLLEIFDLEPILNVDGQEDGFRKTDWVHWAYWVGCSGIYWTLNAFLILHYLTVELKLSMWNITELPCKILVYLAPLPNSAILRVWKRISRSRKRDIFLM